MFFPVEVFCLFFVPFFPKKSIFSSLSLYHAAWGGNSEIMIRFFLGLKLIFRKYVEAILERFANDMFFCSLSKFELIYSDVHCCLFSVFLFFRYESFLKVNKM